MVVPLWPPRSFVPHYTLFRHGDRLVAEGRTVLKPSTRYHRLLWLSVPDFSGEVANLICLDVLWGASMPCDVWICGCTNTGHIMRRYKIHDEVAPHRRPLWIVMCHYSGLKIGQGVPEYWMKWAILFELWYYIYGCASRNVKTLLILLRPLSTFCACLSVIRLKSNHELLLGPFSLFFKAVDLI